MGRLATLMLRAALPCVLLLSAGCASMTPRQNYFAMAQQAQSAYRAGDYPQAEQLYLQVLQAVPGDSSARFMLGNIYAKTGRLYEAESAYRKVLGQNGKLPKAWYNLGIVYAQQAAAAFSQANAAAGNDQAVAQLAQQRAEAILSVLQGRQQ